MKVDYDGRSVTIATGGRDHSDASKPAVVLLHGSGMDRTTWQLQNRWLAHHGYRVAAIDLPGHGSTDGPPLETIEEMGVWTAGLISHLGLGPAHLVGFSLGTYVALEAAAHDSSCAASLVLIGTAATMPVHPELLTSAYDDIPHASRLVTSWGIGARAHRGGHPSPGTWLIGAATALVDRSPENALGHDMAACNAYTGAVEAAGKLTVPVTFVLGTEDKMTPIRASGDLVDAVENKSVIRMDKIGHFMPIEDPIACAMALRAPIGWDGSR